MMSGDDSEECFRERIKEDLEELEKEYATKDWTFSDDNDEKKNMSIKWLVWCND